MFSVFVWGSGGGGSWECKTSMSQQLFRDFVASGSKLAPRAAPASPPSDATKQPAAPVGGAVAVAAAPPPSGKYYHKNGQWSNEVEWCPPPRERVCHRFYWNGTCSGRCPFFHKGPLPLWIARDATADGRDKDRAPSRAGREGAAEGGALAACATAAQLAFALEEGEVAKARNPGVVARLQCVGSIAAGVAALEGALRAQSEEREKAEAELKALGIAAAPAQGGADSDAGNGSGDGGGGGGGYAALAEEPAEAPPSPVAALRKRIGVLQGACKELRKHADAWEQTLRHARACAGACVAASESSTQEGEGEGGGGGGTKNVGAE